MTSSEDLVDLNEPEVRTELVTPWSVGKGRGLVQLEGYEIGSNYDYPRGQSRGPDITGGL